MSASPNAAGAIPALKLFAPRKAISGPVASGVEVGVACSGKVLVEVAVLVPMPGLAVAVERGTWVIWAGGVCVCVSDGGVTGAVGVTVAVGGVKSRGV